MALQPLERFFLIGKRPVGLRFIRSRGHFADVLSGLAVEIRHHMPSQNQRRLRAMIDGLRFGHFPNPDRALGQPGRQRRTSGMIRFDQAQQVGDGRGREAHGQPPHCSRRGFAADARTRQMVFDHGDHAIRDRALDADAIEEGSRHRAAVGFMSPGGPAHLAFALAKHGGGGFGEIVGERREDQHGPIVAGRVLRAPAMRAAASTTNIVCVPTSPSGCQ